MSPPQTDLRLCKGIKYLSFLISEAIANRTEFGPIEPNSDQSDQTRTKLNLV